MRSDGSSRRRRRRPLLFRAAILTGELVLEVPGRLAVAHHHDRRLLARAAAQGALGRAEQHRYCLELLELLLSTSAAVQRGPVSGVDALGMRQRSLPSFTREMWQSQLISPQLMVNTKARRVFRPSRPRSRACRPGRLRPPRPRGATRPRHKPIISARLSLAAAAPANDARASAAAMMWELLGEGRRLLEDGEWRRQPPRPA